MPKLAEVVEMLRSDMENTISNLSTIVNAQMTDSSGSIMDASKMAKARSRIDIEFCSLYPILQTL